MMKYAYIYANAIKSEVVDSLRRFVVDEVEDDGSGKLPTVHQLVILFFLKVIDHVTDLTKPILDWEGSCISSDPLDCQPDLGVQQIGEPDDANGI